MQNEVANDRCGNEAGESEDVGESVDVFMGSELFEGIENRSLRNFRVFAVEMSESVHCAHVLTGGIGERGSMSGHVAEQGHPFCIGQRGMRRKCL